MRHRTIARVLIASVILFLAVLSLAPGRSKDVATADHKAKPIPDGYDFPADAKKLFQLLQDSDVSAMRKHAWLVYAGLTKKDGDKPIWASWHPLAETFADNGAAKVAGIGFAPSRQLDLGHVLEVSDSLPSLDIKHQLPTINLYNEDAYQHIRTNKFYQKATLDDLNSAAKLPAGTPLEKRRIADFPAKAVVLKTFWWPVKGKGQTPLPVWDNDPTHKAADGNGYRSFKRIVVIDPKRAADAPDETTDMVQFFDSSNEGNIIARKGSRIIPMARFFYVKLADADAQAVNQIIGDKFKPFYGREVQGGDYGILVGMHVATKEIPPWVWATFWWHDKPDQGDFAADRPAQVVDVWRNYLMNVAYSSELPREKNGSPHVCYNPYLEAPFANGIGSNCMACHQAAVWPTKPLGMGNPTVKPFQVRLGRLPPDSPVFKDRLKLDFLWSLALESK